MHGSIEKLEEELEEDIKIYNAIALKRMNI